MKRYSLLFMIVFFALSIAFGQMGRDVSKMDMRLRAAVEKAEAGEQLRVIVTMKERYDSQAAGRRLGNIDKATRNVLVQEMQEFAQASQSEILETLGSPRNQAKTSEIKPFWIFNGFSCKADVEMINLISTRNDVAYIEYAPDMTAIDNLEVTPREPVRGYSWNVTKVNADDVWTRYDCKGGGIVVAIIDSGLEYEHPDIKDNLWDGGSQYPKHGYDFFNNDNDPKDDNGHGTHCAGLVAGKGVKGTYTGVAPEAKIMALKVTDRNGNTDFGKVNAAVGFAIENRADVINVPLEMRGTDSAFREMFENVLELGVVVVAPVGDQGKNMQDFPVPGNVSCPGNCPSPWHNPDQTLAGGASAVISVGATEDDDTKASYSSIGPSAWEDYQYGNGFMGLISPDVAAPGEKVVSLNLVDYGKYPYCEVSGTSMAAATATGVVALMLSIDKSFTASLTPARIDEFLESSAVKCGGLGKKNNFYGAGRIDALAAIDAMFATVNPPTNVEAELTGNTAVVSWTACQEASSYNIYKDGELLEENITGTEYIDDDLAIGLHFYYLRSNAADGTQSINSNVAEIVVMYQGPVVSDFQAVAFDGNNVALSWTEPASESATLCYGTNANSPLSWSSGGGVTYWAQKYTASTLARYAGMAITKVSFYAGLQKPHAVKLYKGDANGLSELLFETSVTPSATGWNEIEMTSPVVMDYLNDLWVVCSVSHNSSERPAMSCSYQNGDQNAIYLSSDGKTWHPATTRASWLIKMDITDGSYTYEVYRDDVSIADNVQDTSYIDSGVPVGYHEYYVRTNYLCGKSEPSESRRLPVGIPFTVTFNVGNGVCSVGSLTEQLAGNGVTLPEASPSDQCLDLGYEFIGWAETPVYGTNDEPETIPAGTTYHLFENKTLYAIYRQIFSGEEYYEPVTSLAVGDVVYFTCTEAFMEISGFDGQHATAAPYNGGISALYPFTVCNGNAVGTYAFKNNAGEYMYTPSNDNRLYCNANLDDKTSWVVEFDGDNALITNYKDQTKKIWYDSNSGSKYFTAIKNKSYGSRYLYVNLVRYVNNIVYVYDSNPNCTPGECGTIAEFKGIAESEAATIFGDVTAVYHQGDYLYLKDNTGGLLVHDEDDVITSTYSNGDVISGGIYGKKTIHNGQVMFVPLSDMAEGVYGPAVEPVDVTVADIEANYAMYDSRLVKFSEVSFNEDYTFGATGSTTFTQGGGQMQVSNFFENLNLSVSEGQHGDVVGFVGIDGDVVQVHPRDNADLMIRLMVTFDAGTGTCDTEFLVEDEVGNGILLPEAEPSLACIANGYSFFGWADAQVEATDVPPYVYESGYTYHPDANCTLYAVYAKESEWVAIRDAENVGERNYVVAFHYSEGGWYYLPHEGNVSVNPSAMEMTVTNGQPSATDAIWTFTAVSGGYNISYESAGTTYYLDVDTNEPNPQAIRVTNQPSGVWNLVNVDGHGLMASFTPSQSTIKYLAVRKDTKDWRYYPTGPYYKGDFILFTKTDVMYDSNPECQAGTIATPVFVNVPEGIIVESEYTVEISCATEGASIYYTTDGTQPDNTSTLYIDGGFIINRSCTVQAIAYAQGCLPSEIAIQDFEFESVTQTTSLSTGWNWYSTYIEMDGVDGLSMMEEGLGESGELIKSKNKYVMYTGETWMGSLEVVSNESMYMMKMNDDVELSMTGTEAQASEHPITLNNGWNWIGYPMLEEMTVGEALSGLEPAEDDVLKSKGGYIMYSEGSWIGGFSSMNPGYGYMYKSNNGEDVQFVYGGGKGEACVELLDNEVGHYEYDMRAFANSMTMVVSVVLDGETVAESGMEIGAFVDGECRGGAKIQRVGDTGRYEAFLMIYGEYGENVSFRLYDGNGGMEEYEAEEEVRFMENDNHGSVRNPYTMHFGILGLSEGDTSDAVVYPNPTNGTLRVECGAMRIVTVANAMGQVVYSEEVKADECIIDMGGFTPGAYMLVIRTDGGSVLTKRVTVIR